MDKLTLNTAQKRYLFNVVFSYSDIKKIFDTTDTDWLCKQKVTLKKDNFNWWVVYVDGVCYTLLNPNKLADAFAYFKQGRA